MDTKSINIESGVLYVVATPLGNLGDITYRAVETLAAVDIVAAEDTRHTGRLLAHLGLKKKLWSLHAHNESSQSDAFIQALQAGQSVALVSDAGTPLISDPGFPLIRAAREQGVSVCPIPGASALITALSAAGIPCDRFTFEGFLPSKAGARKLALMALAEEARTLVFYESPHRIADSIADMADVFGDARVAVIARELTKTFEQFERGGLGNLGKWLAADNNHRRGEFVVMVEGVPPMEKALNAEDESLLKHLLEELPVKPSSKLASKITGKPSKAFYARALEFKKEG